MGISVWYIGSMMCCSRRSTSSNPFHVHTSTRTHVHTYTNSNPFHVHTNTRTHVHTYNPFHVHVYAHTHIHTKYTLIHTQVHIYIQVLIYTLVHIHSYIQRCSRDGVDGVWVRGGKGKGERERVKTLRCRRCCEAQQVTIDH